MIISHGPTHAKQFPKMVQHTTGNYTMDEVGDLIQGCPYWSTVKKSAPKFRVLYQDIYGHLPTDA